MRRKLHDESHEIKIDMIMPLMPVGISAHLSEPGKKKSKEFHTFNH